MISFRAYLVIVSKSLSYPTQTQTNYRECLKSFKMVNKIRKSFEVKYKNIFFVKHKLEKFYEHEIGSTSDSQIPGQTAVLYHYCGLSRFFWNQTFLLATYVYSLNIAG